MSSPSWTFLNFESFITKLNEFVLIMGIKMPEVSACAGKYLLCN